MPIRKGSFFECIVCNHKLWRKPSAIKKGENKFCSRDCYFNWQKGKNKIVKNPISKMGRSNPNWKGGLTSINAQIRNSQEYKEWRELVFKRDDWTCKKCFKRSKKDSYLRIEAHHIKPFSLFPEVRFKIDNGLTLCKKCHSKEPKGKEILCMK